MAQSATNSREVKEVEGVGLIVISVHDKVNLPNRGRVGEVGLQRPKDNKEDVHEDRGVGKSRWRDITEVSLILVEKPPEPKEDKRGGGDVIQLL